METYACNFLASLTDPLLPNPFQRSLYLTCEGEERTPFAVFVQISPTTLNRPCQTSQSLDFTALPAELQLHILTFCSSATLFQLMRVSSYLRTEASKLFWAHPDVYFSVEAHWLLDGGHVGHTWDDLDFLAKVQNVQIDDNRTLDSRICPRKRNGTIEVRQDRIASFWTALQKACPRVKRVVINRTEGPRRKSIETHAVPQAIQVLVQSPPLGIKASAFVVERVYKQGNIPSSIDAIYARFPRQRALYKPHPGGSWEKIKSHQDWKVVWAPVKAFSGPVGRFHRAKYTNSRLISEGDGLWFIMAKFVYCHVTSNEGKETFACTDHGCRASFQSAGEWSLHRAVMHNNPRDCDGWPQEEAYKLLPEEAKAEFEQRVAILKAKKDEYYRCMEEMRDEWESSSLEQQREIRFSWMEQLIYDPLWETGGQTGVQSLTENTLWKEFCLRFPYKGSKQTIRQ